MWSTNNTSTAQGLLKAQLKANGGCSVQSLQEKWGPGPDTNLQHVKASCTPGLELVLLRAARQRGQSYLYHPIVLLKSRRQQVAEFLSVWLTVLLSIFQFPGEMKETQSQSRTGVVRETGLASQEGTGYTPRCGQM